MAPPVGGTGVRAALRPARAAACGAVATLGVAIGSWVTLSAVWLLSGLGRWVDASAARMCLVAVMLAAVATDVGIVAKRIPQAQQLIPQSRFNGSLIAGVGGFAFELGLGFRTRLPSASPVVLAIYVLLLASWPEAILLGAGWAIGRCTPIYVRLWTGRATARQGHHLNDHDRRSGLEAFDILGKRLGLAGRLLAPLSIGILLSQPGGG